MATDKTPAYKRVKRAEAGREEWKLKALLRREENEKLAIEVKSKENRLTDLYDQNISFKEKLAEANKKIDKLEKEIEILKKKPSNRR